MNPPLRLGLEVAVAEPPEVMRSCRAFGLLSNQASVDATFRHAADVLHERFPRQLAALFGPQHGLWSTEQDNMIETGHARHPRLGLPVHSLYSETREPTAAMLQGLDLFVVDLQDVGTRVYTYAWTLLHCLRACAAAGIPVLVLDRPNPLGGVRAEGPLLDLAQRSFVGLAPIPMRHGLTLGELARFCNERLAIGAELHVVPMQGWSRAQLWPDSGRAWVPPSPNLPRFEGALVYPGQVLLEGTRLSEGRGTTTPFEQFGAPFVDPFALIDAVRGRGIDGAVLRVVHFEPTFQKHAGKACGGLFVHVTEPAVFDSYRTTVTVLRALRELWPDDFEWLPPPYEYETRQQPIDILSGGTVLRSFVDGERPWADLDAVTMTPGSWRTEVEPMLLYGVV
ncbi:MAG: DUF1343 domain-containing protein [Planctomycetes bacterium]|nr:DUF1343 domain-containing protein [Planctomycetota bacterium]